MLFLGDCLEVMSGIDSCSIDAIIADLPYGKTSCGWDSVIPIETMWLEYKRLLKPNGVIVLFSIQPFTSMLISNDYDMFKYEMVWVKSKPQGHLNAKRMPLRQHETILVFGGNTYNPQYSTKAPNKIRGEYISRGNPKVYGGFRNGNFRSIPVDKAYPRSVIYFSDCYHTREGGLHPTQKPVALIRYLVKTYTNSGDRVLDNAMGSGTTGVACIETGREFIGIEKEKEFFDVARNRIEKSTPIYSFLPSYIE